MIDTAGLNLRQLGRIYLLANIPSYLYRHYRANPTVQDFAKKNTVSDLFSMVARIGRREDRTLDEITQAYAALVALTFKNSQDVKSARAQVSLDGINWAEDILALGFSQRSANHTLQITPLPTIARASVSSPNSTTKVHLLEG